MTESLAESSHLLQQVFFFPPLFRYSTKNPSLQSETVHYKRGVSQQFSLPSFKIDFSDWKDDEVSLLSVSPSFHNPVVPEAPDFIYCHEVMAGRHPLPAAMACFVGMRQMGPREEQV